MPVSLMRRLPQKPAVRSRTGASPPASTARTTGPLNTQAPRRVTLDRLLSKLGLASRTIAQEWILAGRVQVAGRTVRAHDTWVLWPGVAVTLDGQPVEAPAKRVVLFHKPRGLITTQRDERGRATVFDALPAELRALQPIGRLDQATSGLLLLTNDSTLLNFLTDPVNAIPRRYLVTVRGEVTADVLEQATRGILDKDERLRCTHLTIQKRSKRESHLDITLTEGKNREIRRLFAHLGHEVTRLRRIAFGPFVLGDVQPGAWRELSIIEVRRLLKPGPLEGDANP